MMEVSKSDYFIERLEKLIETTKAFEYHKKPVELAYGEPSHYYFDFRRLTGDPEGIYTTANVLYDEINKIGNINSAGGRELGAIPIATAISHLSFTKNPIIFFRHFVNYIINEIFQNFTHTIFLNFCTK